MLMIYLFADDTSIYFESDNLLILQKVVNRELRKVKKWLETNRLVLSISKTSYVIFYSSTTVINEFIRIKLGSRTINQVNYVIYLCVLADSSLTWKPHTIELLNKMARTVGIFFKIQHYVTPETPKLLFCSLFFSFIPYGIPVWGLTHQTTLDPLYKLQKKVVRAITFSNRDTHSTPIFHQL